MVRPGSDAVAQQQQQYQQRGRKRNMASRSGGGGDNNIDEEDEHGVSSTGARGGGGGAVMTTEGRIKSEKYAGELLQSLHTLKVNDELCDFTVSAGGKCIQVHKILLAAMSDYFRAMLQGEMRESQEAKVDLKGISPSALEQIIDFIYTGEMRVDEDNLTDILNAGSHLQIQTVLEICSDYMIANLNFTNSEDTITVAETYNLTRVIRYYDSEVLSKFAEFAALERFPCVPVDKLEQYLSSDRLRIKSESMLYEYLCRWMEKDTEKRECLLGQVLRHIRFCLMEQAELLRIMRFPLTQKYPETQRYIAMGLEYHQRAEQQTRLGVRLHPIVPALPPNQAQVRSSEQSLVLIHQGSSFRPFELCAYNKEQKRFYQLTSDISGCRDCRVGNIGNFLYICRTVDCGGGTLMNSCLRYDPRHNFLAEMSTCKRLRIDCALVVHNSRLYVFGGASENATVSFHDSIEVYDPRTDLWEDEGLMPAPTHSHCGISMSGLIYLVGGINMPERKATTLLQVYNTANRQWSQRSSMHCARRLHEITTTGDTNSKRFYVIGGISGHNMHQQGQIPMELYDCETDQWTIFVSTLAGRSVGHFIAYNGRVLSIGREQQDATEDEIREYDSSEDKFVPYTKMYRGKNSSSNPVAAVALLHINFADAQVCDRALAAQKS